MPAYRVVEVDGVEELEDLIQLHCTTLPGVEKPDFSSGWWWLVYDPEDVPVGYAGMSDMRAWSSYVGAVYLCAAGVLPTERGHGLQRRLIRAREVRARKQGFEFSMTDTIPSNIPSNNNLIVSGYRMFRPEPEWRYPGAIYWRKKL